MQFFPHCTTLNPDGFKNSRQCTYCSVFSKFLIAKINFGYYIFKIININNKKTTYSSWHRWESIRGKERHQSSVCKRARNVLLNTRWPHTSHNALHDEWAPHKLLSSNTHLPWSSLLHFLSLHLPDRVINVCSVLLDTKTHYTDPTQSSVFFSSESIETFRN